MKGNSRYYWICVVAGLISSLPIIICQESAQASSVSADQSGQPEEEQGVTVEEIPPLGMPVAGQPRTEDPNGFPDPSAVVNIPPPPATDINKAVVVQPNVTNEIEAAASGDPQAQDATGYKGYMKDLIAAKEGDKEAIKKLGMNPYQAALGGLWPCMIVSVRQKLLDLIANAMLKFAEIIEKGRKEIKKAEGAVKKGVSKGQKTVVKEAQKLQDTVEDIQSENKKQIAAAQKKLDVVKASKDRLNDAINKCKGKDDDFDEALEMYTDSIKEYSFDQQDAELDAYIKENNVPPVMAARMKKILDEKKSVYYKQKEMAEKELEKRPIERRNKAAVWDNQQQMMLSGFAAFVPGIQDKLVDARNWVYGTQWNKVDDAIKDSKMTNHAKGIVQHYVEQRFWLDILLEKDAQARGKKKRPKKGAAKVFSDIGKGFEKVGKGFEKMGNEIKQGFEKLGDCLTVVGLGTEWASRRATYEVANAALEASKGLQELDPRLTGLRVAQAGAYTAVGAMEVGKQVSVGAMEAARGIMKVAVIVDKALAAAIKKMFNIRSITVLVGFAENALTEKTDIGLPGFDVEGYILMKHFHIKTTINFSSIEAAAKSLWKILRNFFEDLFD